VGNKEGGGREKKWGYLPAARQECGANQPNPGSLSVLKEVLKRLQGVGRVKIPEQLDL